MNIVTGMHRSGTSFVTHILSELGMDIGNKDKLLAADKFNEKGYYENIDIMFLNDQLILGDLFYRKDYRLNPSGKKPMVSSLIMSALKMRYLFLRTTNMLDQRAPHYADEITRVGQNYSNLLVKDPRFSLTLKYWREYSNVDRLLYSFRHPWEVAQSLKRREHLPIWLGLQIWAFHVRTFLEQARDLPVIFVDFDRFFDPKNAPLEMKRCFEFCERNYSGKEANDVLETVLHKDLKNYTARDVKLPEECASLYQKLLNYHCTSKFSSC